MPICDDVGPGGGQEVPPRLLVTHGDCSSRCYLRSHVYLPVVPDGYVVGISRYLIDSLHCTLPDSGTIRFVTLV